LTIAFLVTKLFVDKRAYLDWSCESDCHRISDFQQALKTRVTKTSQSQDLIFKDYPVYAS